VHIASGDLIREVRKAETELGQLVRSYYDRGALVPDDVTIRLVLDRLNQPDCRDGCLLDGFPRTVYQAEALDAALGGKGEQIHRVIAIEVSEAELLRRLGGRWLCKVCGQPYHTTSAPPKQPGVCDLCGGELFQRPDDTEETARNRLEVYVKQTLPLVNYYRGQGKLVEVNGEQQVEDVTKAILDALAVGTTR